VENLPFNIDNLSIKEIFSQCGDFNEVKVYREESTRKCYSYIEFMNKNSVEMALKMDKCISIDNHAICVSKVGSKKFIGYVYNLNKKATEKDLTQFMVDNNLFYKDILFNTKGETRNDATIEFNCKDDLLKAINFKRKIIRSKPFKIRTKAKVRSRNTYTENATKDVLLLLNKKRESKKLSKSKSSQKIINLFKKRNSFNS